MNPTTPSGPSPEENYRAILESPSYILAEEDAALLKRDALRPVRLQLEYLKPELGFQEHDIHSTIVVFGGTRVIEAGPARKRVAALAKKAAQDPGNTTIERDLAIAERVLAKAHYYDEARRLGELATRCQREGRREMVIVTGGGPGVMEAANRGAFETGGKSIGLNITLPHEQTPNRYITPDLCFEFHYFALRKMHFLKRAKALVAFPGGFGTMDELFEALTLLQTGTVQPLPVILVGREFWEKAVDFHHFVNEGTIAAEDLALFQYAETADEVWGVICAFHGLDPQAPEL
jgi:uncharacterized protein (TIGR00730 family)